MSSNQQNFNGGEATSSTSSQDQQTQSGQQQQQQGQMMTQAEYLKYKQEDSNARNFYGVQNQTTTLPVAWDGKFSYDPNNVYVQPNRNASSANSFYGFSTEPTILPTAWDGTFAKSGESRLQPERNRSNDQKYF